MWGPRHFCITENHLHVIGAGPDGLWMRTVKDLHWRGIEQTKQANTILHDAATGQFFAGRSDGVVALMKIATEAEQGIRSPVS